MRTTDERLDHVERVLDEQTDVLAHHSELLEALNATAERQTEHLAAIVGQLKTLHEGIIRALSAATRIDALEDRVRLLEGR